MPTHGIPLQLCAFNTSILFFSSRNLATNSSSAASPSISVYSETFTRWMWDLTPSFITPHLSFPVLCIFLCRVWSPLKLGLVSSLILFWFHWYMHILYNIIYYMWHWHCIYIHIYAHVDMCVHRTYTISVSSSLMTIFSQCAVHTLWILFPRLPYRTFWRYVCWSLCHVCLTT